MFLYKTKQKNHLAFIILLHQEHKWKMFIEIDGEENVLLLVKVRSYTHRKKSKRGISLAVRDVLYTGKAATLKPD